MARWKPSPAGLQRRYPGVHGDPRYPRMATRRERDEGTLPETDLRGSWCLTALSSRHKQQEVAGRR